MKLNKKLLITSGSIIGIIAPLAVVSCSNNDNSSSYWARVYEEAIKSSIFGKMSGFTVSDVTTAKGLSDDQKTIAEQNTNTLFNQIKSINGELSNSNILDKALFEYGLNYDKKTEEKKDYSFFGLLLKQKDTSSLDKYLAKFKSKHLPDTQQMAFRIVNPQSVDENTFEFKVLVNLTVIGESNEDVKTISFFSDVFTISK